MPIITMFHPTNHDIVLYHAMAGTLPQQFFVREYTRTFRTNQPSHLLLTTGTI